jgi:hypothetical protein
MLDSIGTAPPSQLLVLMAFPLVGAALLVAFLAFSFSRRNKKSQMKLGIPPKSATSQEQTAVSNKQNIAPEAVKNVRSDAKPARDELAPASPASDLNLGILSSSDRENRMKTTSPSTDEPKVDLAARLGFSQSAQPAQADEPVELLRLLRDPQSQQLIVEIAGKRYAKLADIVDKEIGQYVLKLAAQLLAFTNGVFLTEAGMKSIPIPKVGKAPDPIEESVSRLEAPIPIASSVVKPNMPGLLAAPKASVETESAFLTSAPTTPPKPAEPKPQRSGLFGLGSGPKTPPPTLPGLNLAEEINDIVQARLRYSPLADSHHISISSDLHGGIRIKVDDQYYTSPDDIQDQAIRDLIKASIKEWERR